MKIIKLIRRLRCKCDGFGYATYTPIGKYGYGASFGHKKSKYKLRYSIVYTWKCEKCDKIKDSYKVRSGLTLPQMQHFMNNINHKK